MDLFRTKSIEQSLADTEEPEFKLKRSLTALDLTVFGVGVIIGAGIFTLTGAVAKEYAGPGVVFSFMLAALCCGLAALCYAEFASTVPVSGSAYTFSYATIGEMVAWIIGWDLLLEMMLGASVVAQGWASYFETLLDQLGITWPEGLGYGDTFNLPAFLLVAVLTVLVAYGIKESMRVNLVLVALKVFIVLFVIVAGIGFINTDNYQPFVPPAEAVDADQGWLHTPLLQLVDAAPPQAYGVMGVLFAASLVFFAYIGFDVVATTAEEANNPQRDLPRGIIGSLVICTVLYVAVALVITGMVKYSEIDPRCRAGQRVHRRGQGRLRDAHLGRSRRRPDDRRDDADHRRDPGDLRDVPRQPAAALVRPRHAPHGHAGAHHPRRRRHRRAGRLADADRQARGDGQHRHPDGLRAGLDRRADPAHEAARPAAVFQRAVLAVAALAVRRDLRLPDAQPHRRDLAAVPGLDGARLRHLLRLRLPASRVGRAAASRSTRRQEKAPRLVRAGSGPRAGRRHGVGNIVALVRRWPTDHARASERRVT